MAACAFLLGDVAAWLLDGHGFLVWGLCALAVCAALTLGFFKKWGLAALSCLLALGLGITNYWMLYTHIDVSEKKADVQATVLSRVDSDTLLVGHITINGKKQPGRAMLYHDSAVTVLSGQKISASSVTAQTPSGPSFDGDFDYFSYIRTKGAGFAVYAGYAKEFTVTGDPNVRGHIDAIRIQIQSHFQEAFGPHAGFLSALVTGSREDVPEDMQEDFNKTGIAHILAISGLHIGLLYAALLWLFGKTPLGYGLSRAVTLCVLFFYCLISGPSSSSLRAFLMCAILTGSQLLARDNDLPTSICLTALIILILQPLTLYTAGFQLSFAAVCGIALLADPIGQKLAFLGEGSVLDAVRSYIGASIGAQIGVLPLLAYYYNGVSLLALLTYAPVAPILTPLMAFALLAALTGFVLPANMVGILCAPAYAGAVAITGIADICAAWPHAYLFLSSPPWWSMALYYAALLLPWFWSRSKRRFRMQCSLAVLAILAYLPAMLHPPVQRLTSTHYDVGSGDSALIQKGMSNILIDCGSEGTGVGGGLRHMGIALDALYLTHGDEDHSGALAEICASVPVEVIYLWEGALPEAYGEQLQKALDKAMEQGTEIRFCKAGDEHPYDGFAVQVLGPKYDYGTDNDNSLVLMIDSADTELLFMGDAGFLPEYDLPFLDVELLKVSHHGSQYGTGQELLERTHPDYAVLSVGENNYGHPHETVLTRLHEADCQIYSTQTSGTLTFSFDDQGNMLAATQYKSP